MNTNDAVNWIQQQLGDTPLERVSLIQPLWNGYGVCLRAYTPSHQQWIVAKVVTANQATAHPKGWQGDVSHQRKCKSYEVETAFYQHYQPTLPSGCPTAGLLASDVTDAGYLLVLSDLSQQGYPQLADTLSVAQCQPVLRWLASFHATGLARHTPDLWPTGTYWHLATRQQEWQAMPEGRLKAAAESLDSRLKQARFQSWVHGDAKVANFCFSNDMQQCAAVDFQYVGRGAGVKDVAYFLGSALSEADQARSTQDCLEHYFDYLAAALKDSLSAEDIDALIKEWRDLYNVACADFQRFLCGWSPGHWKLNKHLMQRTERALHQLNVTR